MSDHDLSQVDPDEIIERVKKDDAEAKELVVTQLASFKGPLPPPAMLAKYGDIIPNAPDRIMTMAEKSLDQQIENDRTLASLTIKESRRLDIALGFGILLCILFFAASFYFLYIGLAEWWIFFLTPIVGLISLVLRRSFVNVSSDKIEKE